MSALYMCASFLCRAWSLHCTLYCYWWVYWSLPSFPRRYNKTLVHLATVEVKFPNNKIVFKAGHPGLWLSILFVWCVMNVCLVCDMLSWMHGTLPGQHTRIRTSLYEFQGTIKKLMLMERKSRMKPKNPTNVCVFHVLCGMFRGFLVHSVLSFQSILLVCYKHVFPWALIFW